MTELGKRKRADMSGPDQDSIVQVTFRLKILSLSLSFSSLVKRFISTFTC